MKGESIVTKLIGNSIERTLEIMDKYENKSAYLDGRLWGLIDALETSIIHDVNMEGLL